MMKFKTCMGICLFNALKFYTVSSNLFTNYIYIPFLQNLLSSNKENIILDNYEITHNTNKKVLYFNKKEIEPLEKSEAIKYYKISDVKIDNTINCIVPCTFTFMNITVIHYGISYDIEINNKDYNFNCEYNKIDPYFIKWYIQQFYKIDIICDSNTILSFIDDNCDLKEINLIEQYILLEKDNYKIINN